MILLARRFLPPMYGIGPIMDESFLQLIKAGGCKEVRVRTADRSGARSGRTGPGRPHRECLHRGQGLARSPVQSGEPHVVIWVRDARTPPAVRASPPSTREARTRGAS